jgi:hypothetical protein
MSDTKVTSPDPDAARPAHNSQGSTPLPESIPRATIWPAVLALGIVAGVWGVLTSLYMTVVGIIVSIVGIGGWIREIMLENSEA